MVLNFIGYQVGIRYQNTSIINAQQIFDFPVDISSTQYFHLNINTMLRKTHTTTCMGVYVFKSTN